MKTWVLAGQSNMQGAAPLEGAPAPDPRVFSFSSAGVWQEASEPLQNHWESCTPVHKELARKFLPAEKRHLDESILAKETEQTRIVGAGPGLSFGIAMADALEESIGLIPAAHGGTSLAQWMPVSGTDTLYGSMMDRIHRAGGELSGLVWYQGENDAADKMDAENYEAGLSSWIESARRDLKMPELPIILVQIARRAMGPLNTPEDDRQWNIVRRAALEISARLPGIALVSTADLGLSDVCHLNTRSQIVLGKRLAQVFLRMKRGIPGSLCSPRMHSVEIIPALRGLGELRIRCTGVSGPWTPASRIAGFLICTRDGLPHPDRWVIQASADPKEPDAIRLILNEPVHESGCFAGYALGADPFCNATDTSGMALAAGIIPCHPESFSDRQEKTSL